jgi:hypothetical protein
MVVSPSLSLARVGADVMCKSLASCARYYGFFILRSIIVDGFVRMSGGRRAPSCCVSGASGDVDQIQGQVCRS